MCSGHVAAVSHNQGDDFGWGIADGRHSVRVIGIVVDAVSRIQDDDIAVDDQFEGAFEYVVEFLAGMGVEGDLGVFAFGGDGDEEGLCLLVGKIGCQCLVLVLATTVDGDAFSSACRSENTPPLETSSRGSGK